MFFVLRSIVIFLVVGTTTTTFGCVIKSYPNSESFVCVCDENDCDSVDRLPHSLSDHLTIFLTDKASHRLSKSLIHLDDLVSDSIDSVDVHVTINSTDKRQSIIGFGGAFTDAAGINLNKLTPDLADKLMNDYYGETGLHYTLSRVPLGGSDFSDRPYSNLDTEGDYELKTFQLAPEDFNYKIPYIKKAFNLSSELRLFASPWSSPAWLKTNKVFNGLGMLEGEPGSRAWGTWAACIVRFFELYRDNGVNFWGFTPENEPNMGLIPGWRWNALGFTGSMMREFIKKDLGPALTAAGFTKDKLKMMIYDDNLSSLMPFLSEILKDPEASQYISGIAYHWYSKGYYEVLEQAHDLYSEYFLLGTEACEGFIFDQEHVSLGNWTRAENIVEDVIEGLNRWSTGWTDWNIVLDEQGGPNWANNLVDAFVIVNSTSNEYYKQPMYYAFGHFSKFLRPGSIHISHGITIKSPQSVDANKLKMTTFISPTNEMILTVLNRHESSIKMSIEGVTNKPFTLTIEPRSLTTLIKPIL